jgi:hypothetical protein
MSFQRDQFKFEQEIQVSTDSIVVSKKHVAEEGKQKKKIEHACLSSEEPQVQKRKKKIAQKET